MQVKEFAELLLEAIEHATHLNRECRRGRNRGVFYDPDLVLANIAGAVAEVFNRTDTEWQQLAEILLQGSWNDSIDWARTCLGKK